MPELAIFSNPDMALHEPGPSHPERPARLAALRNAIESASFNAIEWRVAQPIDRELLQLVHTDAYIAHIESLAGKTARLDDDTVVSPHSVNAALISAGAAVQATGHVLNGQAHSGYALVRPPGHHAGRSSAMGFCLFNNVAIAAADAIANRGLSRVLVLDWDVHHGNGTQDIFYQRNDVLFVSIQQFPQWPGTGAAHELGEGPGEGFSINIPLHAQTSNELYLGVIAHVVAPIARQFKPELILISAGFDAHEDDPLGEMRVTPAGFAGMCAMMRNLSDELCDSRIVLVQEGGYSLPGIGASAVACVRVLNREDAPEQLEALAIATPAEVAPYAAPFRPYWRI